MSVAVLTLQPETTTFMRDNCYPMKILYIYRIGFLTLSLSLILALFIGGSQPGAGGLFVPPVDKLIHFLYFATFTFSIIMSNIVQLKYTAILAAMLGAADELHQMVLPGRSPGVDDWLADLVGAVTVVCIFSIIRKRQNLKCAEL